MVSDIYGHVVRKQVHTFEHEDHRTSCNWKRKTKGNVQNAHLLPE